MLVDHVPNDIRRILIVKPSSLGDIIHALPVLSELRRRFPDAHISWLVGRPFVEIIEGHPQLNEVIPFDRKAFGHFGRRWSATSGFLRFLRELRGRRFDLVIDLQGLFRSGLITGATRAKRRIGFRQAREGAWLFYNHPVHIGRSDIHAVDKNLALLTALGILPGEAEFDLALTDADAQSADSILEEHGLDRDEPYIVFAPGARWETKLWPAERFGQAADRLVDHCQTKVVIVGAPSEHDRNHQVAAAATKKHINITGQTTLRQLSAVIDRASLVLCHDSAPMHLADALQTPLVSITGPTNPARTGPYRQRDGVIQLDIDCAPCYLRKLSQCRHQHRCMADMTVDMVTEKIRNVLSVRTHAARSTSAHEKGTP